MKTTEKIFIGVGIVAVIVWSLLLHTTSLPTGTQLALSFLFGMWIGLVHIRLFWR